MPGKLVVVLVLYAIAILLSAITGTWLAAAIQIGCFIGLMKGNDMVRKIVIFFNALGLAWVVVQGVQLISLLNTISALDGSAVAAAGMLGFGVLAFSFVASAFTIFALTRSDVKQWMLYRGMGNLEAHLDGPSTF